MSERIRQTLRLLLEAETRRLPATPSGGLAVAVVYPNEYRVGMANLGLHALLEVLQQQGQGRFEVDRCFLPGRREMAEHQRSGAPVLGMETGRSLAMFDVLMVSLSFEPDAVGLVQMLQLSGVEPLAERRDERAPLVVAGGMAPTLNPEPLAPFCDLIGLGEAEALLPALLEALAERPGRRELLEQAATLPGWYVPALLSDSAAEARAGAGDEKGRPAARPLVIRQHAPLERPCMPMILAPGAAFSGHVDLEISRGCRWRCAFCAAGHVITPYRELLLEALEPSLAWALAQRGKVGLIGTDVSDHSGLEAIVRGIWDRGGQVALPSLRVERLGDEDSAALRLIRERPPRTVTMAVEAADEALRRQLNKRLDDDRLRQAAENMAAAGVANLRVYLLAAVPGERWEHVEAMVDLARDLVRLGPGGRLALSVTGMVPKPGTPMQWEPAPDRGYLRRVRDHLRAHLPGKDIELSFESPDWTRWQALLSLGGRETARYILEAAERGWRRTLKGAADEVPLLQGQGRARADALPWARVDNGARHDKLWRARVKRMEGPKG